MLYGIVITIHVIVSLVLIAVILLQAGRGGGLSESFGGSSTQTIFGTKTPVFLTRATAAAAIIYIITCLTLAVMTGHKGRSLVSKENVAAPGTPGAKKPFQPLPEEPLDF
ncbi:MAG: preprotein translocase subunit SecG [Omnitrophica bacterium RIFCSPLOWO2_01_FULL_45_10]|nr:MAG: preprotein translocase subunit SecG [Omnitrophica bacterium RIFCSPLOWO2_01_FULL_45_10]